MRYQVTIRMKSGTLIEDYCNQCSVRPEDGFIFLKTDRTERFINWDSVESFQLDDKEAP